jgi:hypothetical protein
MLHGSDLPGVGHNGWLRAQKSIFTARPNTHAVPTKTFRELLKIVGNKTGNIEAFY